VSHLPRILSERRRQRAASATRSPGRSRGTRSLALVGLLTLLAGPALADAPAASVADPVPRVAGAIDRASGPEAAGIAERVAPSTRAKPTTRASVRARIAAIDPAHWLARFGETEHHSLAHR